MTAPGLTDVARLPRTLLGALRQEVETATTRLSWYTRNPPRTKRDLGWQKEYSKALASARRELDLFEAGMPPRLMPGAGSHELRKNAAGARLCRWCDTEIAKNRTFCGDLCVHEWKLRTDAGYARKLVFERDAGKCALCPVVLGRTDRWEMDHVVPVVEGGGCCGLENLRVLCPPCHRGVTAQLARRRAEGRRERGPVLPGLEVA